jgi:hypothetical protein
MQDVTGDPPEAQCMDSFFDSPDTQPRKPRKQNCSRNQKSILCHNNMILLYLVI